MKIVTKIRRINSESNPISALFVEGKWVYTSDVIREIKNGVKYQTQNGGIIEYYKSGNAEYLRTKSDTTINDNLDSLPCEVVSNLDLLKEFLNKK